MQKLYNSGARKIVVCNVGPFGCIPNRLALANSSKCVAFENQMADGFNSALKLMLPELTKALPGSMFLYGDSYSSLLNLINNPASQGTIAAQSNESLVNIQTNQHWRELIDFLLWIHVTGFAIANQGCCGAGMYKGQLPCNPFFGSLCKNRSTYIFWDPYHPTEAVNVILFNKLFQGSTSEISPMNVYQLSKWTPK